MTWQADRRRYAEFRAAPSPPAGGRRTLSFNLTELRHVRSPRLIPPLRISMAEWLRDELGDRFASGVVLHTGPSAFELADRIVAAPISTL
jgi:hypothetical protein